MEKLFFTLEKLINEASLSAYEREECRLSLNGIKQKLQEVNKTAQELRNEVESIKEKLDESSS